MRPYLAPEDRRLPVKGEVPTSSHMSRVRRCLLPLVTTLLVLAAAACEQPPPKPDVDYLPIDALE